MRTLQRLLIIFAFAIAGLFISSATLATPAFACGYFTGYDDCGKPRGWDNVNPGREYKPYTKKDPGRHGGIEIGPTWRNECRWFCGEGYRQRKWQDPAPVFPHLNGSSDMCPDGHPRMFGVC
jgi:hypothetical protein